MMAASGAYQTRKLWTREEALKLSEMFPGVRYELIEGELINKMGQNPPHAFVIALLNSLFARVFFDRVRVQLSIALPDPDGNYSEPEPDLVLLYQQDAGRFASRHPGPADIALLIEVADSSFPTDRTTKYKLYARGGVAEYWIVDIPNRRVVVCRRPSGDEYLSVEIVLSDEPLSPRAEPGFGLTANEILPPA